ncbi:HNH endonuclease signature motif containing protein [Nonomuraea indica]|uniref:HNH endonuclease signature motif containing protein n=1 Tax=Nonomuraea indica TaxID=1581193 RepID=UPI000C7CCD4E|nr:HNH endonuclease signature motif containing protein [Nonomuraea indica]
MLWTGALDKQGYGVIWDSQHGNNRKVHRVAYELANGEPPAGDLDHLCRVRRCAAAPHLEVVTAAENAARGDVHLNNGGKTHCPRGHAYDEANTRWTTTAVGKGRECRACDREKWRAANGVPLDAPLRSERATCKNGHPWTEENTYWAHQSGNGKLRRQCRACKRERARRS